MTAEKLAQMTLLPELEIEKIYPEPGFSWVFALRKKSEFEVCPKCAKPSFSIYDRRIVDIKDAPLRHGQILLRITKRRFNCFGCKKPFTEPVQGISKGYRTTNRLREYLYKAAENYTDFKRVKEDFPVSRTTIYQYYYKQMELERKKRLYPWPKKIGIDEHSFSRRGNNPTSLEWVSVIVDHKGKRLMEVVKGRTIDSLKSGLEDIKKRENVTDVTIDMSQTYRSFVYSFFKNAKITIDKFHVVRLFQKEVNIARLEVTGDKRKNPIRKLVLRNFKNLQYDEKLKLNIFLNETQNLKEMYWFRERLQSMYRNKSIKYAKNSFDKLAKDLSLSKNSVCKRLSQTLLEWKEEILNYFYSRLTNARAEGFNNKAKLIKRRAYGYRSFENYRLRLLSACA